MKRSLVAVLTLIVVLCGCQSKPAPHDFKTSATYEPYTGEQRAWQTQPDPTPKVVDGVEIYPSGQVPARPYQIVGKITVAFQPGTDVGLDEAMAATARRNDAGLVIMDKMTGRSRYLVVEAIAANYQSPTSRPAPTR